MIDVRELKIGNYVYLQNSKTPYKITEVGYRLQNLYFDLTGKELEISFL